MFTFRHQHLDIITSLDWSTDGKLYASGSLDGAIKIWDGVSSHCVATYVKAHDGVEVSSVRFTRNGKYVLSSGKDSLIKLWELSTNRCLIAYTGAGATGKQVSTTKDSKFIFTNFFLDMCKITTKSRKNVFLKLERR